MGPERSRALRGIAFMVLLAVTLLLVHLIATNHDVARDVTEAGSSRLDPRTVNILRKLNFDVRILLFDQTAPGRSWGSSLPAVLARESRRVTMSVVDPDLKPALARRYGIARYGQAVVIARGRTVVLDSAGEEELANAILSLEQGKKENVYVLSGHGEPALSDKGRAGLSGLKETLERAGYGVRKCVLSASGDVPWDTDLLIVPGPRADLGPEELRALGSFVGRGGNVIVALEPRMDGGLKIFLSSFGIWAKDAMILDSSSKALGADESVLVVDAYGGLTGLEKFAHDTVFPTARPLMIEERLPARTNVSAVVMTSGTSRAAAPEGPDAGNAQAARKEKPRSGPFTIALLSKKVVGKEIRPGVLVFGDSDFLTNGYLPLSGNRDLVMACVDRLLHGDTYIAVEPWRASARPFVLTPGQAAAVFIFSVVLLPLPILLTGLLVKRRRSRT